MSHHLSNRAWDIELKGNQKIVLLALAHMSIQSTGKCSVTVARLAFMCGLSDSCVRAQLKTLIAKRHISLVPGALEGGAHMYRLDRLLATAEPNE
jgi:hypothetical protein